jgi:hypothetical protein
MIGKEVLCIKTNVSIDGKNIIGVKKGKVYLINGVIKCKCGSLNYDVSAPVIDRGPGLNAGNVGIAYRLVSGGNLLNALYSWMIWIFQVLLKM